MAAPDPVTILVADGEPPRKFASASDALAAAKQLQPGTRIGIHSGAGDEARALATRLCAAAGPDQVLTSAAVRALALSRGEHEFRELDALALDGLPTPLAAWELLWSEPPPRTRARLCGQLALEVDGRDLAPGLPGGQAGALLAYLLSRPGHCASRDELIAITWPQAPPQDPPAALRPLLSRLRRALAPATIEGRQQLRLALPEPIWIDAEVAASAVEAARDAARRGAWASAGEQAAAARELLGPGFLPGQEGEWAEARRRELEELELEALELLARAGLALGGAELAGAERAGRELIARSPYRETGHRFLMEALAGAGNAAEALRVYDELRLLLREELGASPAPELQALHQRLLAGADGDSTAAPVPVRAAAEPAPRVALPSVLAPRGSSAFVGRERELAALREAWLQARGGSRRLALVAGEPGIGKTRLLSELARGAQAEGAVLYAACQEEALVSYQPFVEALRQAGAALPEAAEPAGDPETRRFLLFEAVAALLADLAARQPLLLVLDDLHWADRATLHLLRHLVRAPQQVALLIVGAYREAEVDGEHPLTGLLADLRRERLFERLSLDGLDADGVSELIALHAGHEASTGLVGTVHAHTEGNPFFVEEVMRHLIETGVLFERGGRWSSALTPDEIGVPEGVREVLGDRLGRLSEECRAVLAAAAVLGRGFRFETLAAMKPAEEEALITALEEAVAAQLVIETDGSGAHEFTHALVRETLYARLGAPRRQRLHAAAAAAIETVEGEAPVAALALHQRLAGPAGDPEKAIAYSVRAGAEARRVAAWDEAAEHWSGALEAMARRGGGERERAELHVALGDLMGLAGNLSHQIANFESALALYEELGDEQRTAQAHSRLGGAHSLIDSIFADHLDIGVAFAHFEAARPVLEQGPPRKALGHLEAGVATALTYGVSTAAGIEAGARAMEIGERVGDELLWATGAESGGWHLIAAGELGAGFAQMERATAVADREQRSLLAWMGLNICGQMTWGLGAPDEAEAYFERHIALPYVGKTTYRQETADGIGRCHFSRGELEAARRLLSDARPAWVTHALKPLVDLWDGRWDEVAALAAQTLATSRRNGNRWDEWASNHLAGRVEQLRGEGERAAASLERALAIVAAGGAVYFELWVRLDLARLRAERGELEQARAQVERCREIVGNGEDWRGRAGQVELATAVLAAGEGRAEEAEAGFARALATFEAQKLVAEEADALRQWGRALAAAGSRHEAAAALERALASYREHGAGERWQARVEADLRSLARC